MSARFIEIGRISKPHGLKGDVKVCPASSNYSVFRESSDVYLPPEGKVRQKLHIFRVRAQGRYLVLHFRGLDVLEDVEPLRGKMISLPEGDFPPLPEGECYQFQIIGMEVLTESGEQLGTVQDIIETGGNDVYEVARENGTTLLIPATGDVIKRMRPQEKKMIIRVIDGLLDAN